MTLDLKLVLIAGVLWGIVGVALIVLAAVLGPMLPFQVDGLAVATFAIMFAGVHFVYRNPTGLVVDLIGGVISGVIAALILIVASMFLPIGGQAMGSGDIIGAIAAGFAGALGMVIIERTSGIGR